MPDTQEAPHIKEAAMALRTAREQRRAIAQISVSHGVQGLAAAYAVAERNTRYYVEAGRKLSGKKIGLTSKAVQAQLGVDSPDFGVLFADMEYLNGSDVPLERLIQPKAEAEVAFVMARDLKDNKPSWAQFLAAIDYALPAIEIVDSAIIDWKITLVDTVADNASSGLYVLGNQPSALGNVALDEIGMQMTRNGQVASTGTGSACLDHPLRAAYWLASTMAERGQGLKAGEIILSGALGPMVPISAGDHFDASFGPLGRVSFKMV